MSACLWAKQGLHHSFFSHHKPVWICFAVTCLRHQLTTAQPLWTGLVKPTLSAVTFKTCQSPLLCSELCNQNGTERASCDPGGQWNKKFEHLRKKSLKIVCEQPTFWNIFTCNICVHMQFLVFFSDRYNCINAYGILIDTIWQNCQRFS